MDEMEEEYGLYCDKCGMTYVGGTTIRSCEVCENKLKIIPDEYFITEEEKEFCELSEESEQRLREDLVLTSPNFDQYYFDHREEILDELNRKSDEDYAKWKQMLAKNAGADRGNPYGITCPYCKATNIRKIGLISRSVSAGIFGLGSKKIGKQWHCDHCGSDF